MDTCSLLRAGRLSASHTRRVAQFCFFPALLAKFNNDYFFIPLPFIKRFFLFLVTVEEG